MKQHMPDLDFSRPQVMAIVNVTPDSFYAPSRTPDREAIEARIRRVAAEGAAIIDIGGYSSRPGADEVDPDEELRRVLLGTEAARRLAPAIPVSIDTFRASVAEEVIRCCGPVIVNDISAGELDGALPETAARYDVPYIAMHMKGDPQTMQSLTDYRREIVAEVLDYFETRIARLRALGMRRERLILDPGFG